MCLMTEQYHVPQLQGGLLQVLVGLEGIPLLCDTILGDVEV